MIKLINDSKNLEEDFAQSVTSSIIDSLKDSRVVLFLSGGSVIGTYSRIAELLEEAKINYSRLSVGQIDERYDINPLHKDSNQGFIRDTYLFNHLYSKGVDFKFMLTGASIEAEVKNYSKYLSKIYSLGDAKLISIMGVGPDAHTGGIKPLDDEKEFRERYLSDKLVFGYEASDFTRMTQTLSSLKKHDQFFVYMKGDQKTDALSAIADEGREVELNKQPAQIYRLVDEVNVFTDIII